MCKDAVWALVVDRRASSFTVEAVGDAGAVVTLTRPLQPRELEHLSTTVAALAHDAPNVVVDLRRVPEPPAEVLTLLNRLAALTRGAGGELCVKYRPGSSAPAAAEPLPVRCAWCGRWRVDDEWRSERVADDRAASHGICPDCFRVAVLRLIRGGDAPSKRSTAGRLVG